MKKKKYIRFPISMNFSRRLPCIKLLWITVTTIAVFCGDITASENNKELIYNDGFSFINKRWLGFRTIGYHSKLSIFGGLQFAEEFTLVCLPSQIEGGKDSIRLSSFVPEYVSSEGRIKIHWRIIKFEAPMATEAALGWVPERSGDQAPEALGCYVCHLTYGNGAPRVIRIKIHYAADALDPKFDSLRVYSELNWPPHAFTSDNYNGFKKSYIIDVDGLCREPGKENIFTILKTRAGQFGKIEIDKETNFFTIGIK